MSGPCLLLRTDSSHYVFLGKKKKKKILIFCSQESFLKQAELLPFSCEQIVVRDCVYG